MGKSARRQVGESVRWDGGKGAILSYLNLDNLCKRFGDTLAVDRVTLEIARGQTLVLLGPSGSGKTTTLRMLAGFESPDEGRVLVDGEDVTRTPPPARRFGMVFQHYALFPHLDVRGNVAFGLESRGVTGPELERRVAEALVLVELTGLESRRIDQLSGGQQQRVAVARALAPEPRVLLLDEPLSNLDPTLREKTRRELRAVIQRVGITTVLVTHDQEEAFDLGDQIAVLRQGRVEQAATADELYAAPANPFVAGFVGRASTFAGEVVETSRDQSRVRVEGAIWTVLRPVHLPMGSKALVLARPEALAIVEPAASLVCGVVTERRFAGAMAFFSVRTDRGTPVEVSAGGREAAVGRRVGLVPRDRGIHLFPAESR